MLEHIPGIFIGNLKFLLIAWAIGTAVEMLITGERQTWLSRVRGFAFWLVYTVFGVFVVLFTQIVMRWLAIKPFLSIDLAWMVQSDNPLYWLLGYTVVPFAGLFIYDFFYYCFHRAQHTIPILWRLHSTHHSIEELNCFNDYHHIFEDLLRFPIIIIPMAALVSVSVPQIAITVFLLSIYGLLIHANTKLQIGPLRYLLAEPRHHRIHHSLERKHWNKNYAALFPIWDVIFGTVHFPRKDEYPRTGLSYVREPRSLAEYLVPKARPKTPPEVGTALQARSEIAQRQTQRRDVPSQASRAG
jgi:sterol desaturase/sphingolipid hydroxylase (fatty acid hydroxylase superfamily)